MIKTKISSLSLPRVWVALPSLAAMVLASVAQAATVPGATPGHFAVSNSGSATYRIPLQAPPGIADMLPQLALQYDSQGARGIVGPGWSLDGVQAIRRCPKTIAQDGERAGISLTSIDRFCLGAQRLGLKSGQAASVVYGADQAEYRTELESFARVKSYGTAGTGPEYFVVEEKGGLKLKFGSTSDSRLIPGKAKATDVTPTTVLTWYLSEIADRHGNTITFRYDRLTEAGSGNDPAGPTRPVYSGEIVLKEVSYAGGKAKLKLEYIADKAPRTMYVAGTRIEYTKLLDKVSTYSFDGAAETLVKHYKLDYEFEDVKGTSDVDGPVGRLISVTECADAGATKCLRPTKFTWNHWKNGEGGFSKDVIVKVGAGDPNLQKFLAPAFGGDGRGAQGNIRRFADLNGDGRPDIVLFIAGGVYVYYSKNDSEFESNAVRVSTEFGADAGFNHQELYPRFLLDMNGDGYSDIVAFDHKARSGYVALWNPGGKYFESKQKIIGESIFTGDANAGCSYAYGDAEQFAARVFADFNGDGYPDMVRSTRNGVYIAYWDPNSRIFVNSQGRSIGMDKAPLSRGDPDLVGPSLSNRCVIGWSMNADFYPLFPMDMDGDGHPDLVAVQDTETAVLFWQPALKRFTEKKYSFADIHGPKDFPEETRPIHVEDMNGDGLPDLLQLRDDGVYVALWTGAGFLPASKWTSEMSGGYWSNGDAKDNPRQLVDLNGDGLVDFVGFDGNGVFAMYGNGKSFSTKRTLSTEIFATHRSTDYTSNYFGNQLETPRFLLDVKGVGTPALMGFGTNNIPWVSNGKTPGERIATIEDGLGAKVEIGYGVAQPLTNAALYKRGSSPAAFPVREAHGPLYVVSSVNKGDGIGGTRKTTYTYKDRRADFHRGLLGFAAMTSKDEATSIETEQLFSQSYPFIGQVSGSTTKTASGVKLIELSNTLDKEVLDAVADWPPTSMNKHQFVYTSKVVETRKDLQGTDLWTKTTTNKYEKVGGVQWGDLTSQTVEFGDQHKVETTNDYLPVDETNWLLGRLSTSTVKSTRPTRLITTTTPTDAPQAVATTPLPPKQNVGQIMSIIIDLLLSD